MTTTRAFRATGAQQLALSLPSGAVRVSIDPDAAAIAVLLTTADDTGPAADAVRQARSWEDHARLSVDVPQPDSGFTYTGGITVHQSFGTVTGDVTGLTIINGRVVDGGRPTVSVSPVTATVLLPPTALGIALKTTSANLTATGHLPVLAVSSVSGDVRVQSVNVLSATTVSGDVVADRLGADAEIHSTSGDVRIGVHEGHAVTIRTVSGDVHLTAGARATGTLTVRTVSGDTELHGTGRLDVRTRTVSGRTRRI